MPNPTIAIVGNPNCGKTALFNQLSGLRQKTGNFAGVTVDKKTADIRVDHQKLTIVDLPGTYSLYPLTEDEHIVAKVLLDPANEVHPDAVLFIADPDQLERHLLLYTQIRDLGFPMFLGLSMADVAEKKGLKVDTEELARRLGHPVVSFSIRNKSGLDVLSKELISVLEKDRSHKPIYALTSLEDQLVKDLDHGMTPYGRLVLAHHATEFSFLEERDREEIERKKKELSFDAMSAQVEETLSRFNWIERIISAVVANEKDYLESNSLRADRIITHKLIGPLIFLFILFLMFQAIYTIAEAPMQWIEQVFALSSNFLKGLVPAGWARDMVTEGILPGLAGVLVFIPQISILFFILGLLEESGYLARAVFLFDRFFQRLGLNGRSLIAFVSASACAIPAIMSTRSIKSRKERILTIMVTPFISCSARTPVYIVLVGFIVANQKIWGIISLQGLVFLSFYLLGIGAVIIFALILRLFLKSNEPSFLMLELPDYKWPNLTDILFSTWLKVKSFIIEAGKIIFLISMVLWVMASYGPSGRDAYVEEKIEQFKVDPGSKEASIDEVKNAALLESSYAGILGKWIEPVIRPLGYDWKIGIALITSFAAREVFVSTMATIYSIGSEEDTEGIKQKMQAEVNSRTGEKQYTQATALSLIVFYIFAMQCMSTLAVVRKETGSWKWPAIQFFMMTGLAYLASLIVYQVLS
ncbi:MAG: ferrous iron transport protein B [Saprospiraceae bacterium]|nr:ferrous iron transport protein B [Saprospiraceae bacterium]